MTHRIIGNKQASRPQTRSLGSSRCPNKFSSPGSPNNPGSSSNSPNNQPGSSRYPSKFSNRNKLTGSNNSPNSSGSPSSQPGSSNNSPNRLITRKPATRRQLIATWIQVV